MIGKQGQTVVDISVLKHRRLYGEGQDDEDRAVITAVHRILLEVGITIDEILRFC